AFCRRGDDECPAKTALLRFLLYFERVHAGVIHDGDKAEDKLALRIRMEIMKSLVPGPQRTAGLFENVEILQQGRTVAIDIEDPAPRPAHRRAVLVRHIGIGILYTPISLRKMQGDLVFARGDRNRVTEIAVALAGV